MATTSGVYPCYENQFTIDGKTIADCESFSVSFDNGVEEWRPFEEKGWVRRLLTAKGVTITVSGKRSVGDDGNDLVAGLAWLNGRDAEKDFVWNFPDGTRVEFQDAVINVTNIGSADAADVAPLEFEVQSNGKPTVTPNAGA